MSDQTDIHWGQFRTLVRTFLKMNARGRSGRSMYGRALSILLSYGISATYLGFSLSTSFQEPVYILLTAAVTMYLAAFTVLNSYTLILLDPNEERILSLFPISTKTIFIARITNLILYVLFVSLPFGIPLAWFFLVQTQSVASTMSYVVVLILSVTWTTGLFIILYNMLITRFSHSNQVLSLTQTILVFILLFFYQSLPSISASQSELSALFSHDLFPLVPTVWFTALHGLLVGQSFMPMQVLYALLAVSTLLFMMLFMRTSLMLLPDLNTPISRSSEEKRVKRLSRLSDLFKPREPALKAGYDLFLSFLQRERSVRLQLIPVLMMSVAVGVYGSLTGKLASPFVLGILAESSQLHIPVVVFFLFSVRHVDHVIGRATNDAAVWMLRTLPSSILQAYVRGIRHSVSVRLILPVALLLFLIFTFSMTLQDAALQTIFILTLGRMQSNMLVFFSPIVPFSETRKGLGEMARFAQFFVIVPFFIIGLVLHHLTFHSTAAFALVLVALESCAQICRFALHSRVMTIPST